jgi:hypothetical protein
VADPYAIVLVPTEAGAALMADGACGSVAPRVGIDSHNGRWSSTPRRAPALNGYCLCPGCGQWTPRNHPEAHEHLDACSEVVRVSSLSSGLPLVWDGMPVPDGAFRAWNAWGPDEDEAEFGATGWTTYDVLAEALDGASAAEWLARSLERMGLCRVVLLDLVGGALVERAP